MESNTRKCSTWKYQAEFKYDPAKQTLASLQSRIINHTTYYMPDKYVISIISGERCKDTHSQPCSFWIMFFLGSLGISHCPPVCLSVSFSLIKTLRLCEKRQIMAIISTFIEHIMDD